MLPHPGLPFLSSGAGRALPTITVSTGSQIQNSEAFSIFSPRLKIPTRDRADVGSSPEVGLDGIPHRRYFHRLTHAPDRAGAEGREDDGVRPSAQPGVAGNEIA